MMLYPALEEETKKRENYKKERTTDV